MIYDSRTIYNQQNCPVCGDTRVDRSVLCPEHTDSFYKWYRFDGTHNANRISNQEFSSGAEALAYWINHLSREDSVCAGCEALFQNSMDYLCELCRSQNL